jgi:hypothetical protein
MSSFLGIVLGVVTGIASSIIFWFLQFRVFRTKLKISPTIARYTYVRGGIRNQLKIRNVSRRDVVEVSVTIRAILPGLVRPTSQTVITLGEWRRPVLKKRDEVQYQVRPEFMPEDEHARHTRNLPLEMVEAIKAAEPVDLIDFLNLAPESYIEVYVFGTDAVSGARGFAAQRITAQEVRSGAFLPGSFKQTGQFDISTAPSANSNSSK